MDEALLRGFLSELDKIAAGKPGFFQKPGALYKLTAPFKRAGKRGALAAAALATFLGLKALKGSREAKEQMQARGAYYPV